MAGKSPRTFDLSQKTGPTVSTGDVSRATGLSDDTVRRDIEHGELRATRRHGKAHYRITWRDFRRYVLRMCGGLPGDSQNAANAANVNKSVCSVTPQHR